jgi:hypothetical protein
MLTAQTSWLASCRLHVGGKFVYYIDRVNGPLLCNAAKKASVIPARKSYIQAGSNLIGAKPTIIVVLERSHNVTLSTNEDFTYT